MRRRLPSGAARPAPPPSCNRWPTLHASLEKARRPAAGRELRSVVDTIELAEVAVGLGCDRRGFIIRQCRANRHPLSQPTPTRLVGRRRARPARRATVLARGPAAAGQRRGHRTDERARRDLPGAARGVHPPRGRDPRGRAGHRQDAPAARRGRPRGGERVHLRRHHRRRGDPRAVPRGAEPVRLDRDPRGGRGDAGRSHGQPRRRRHLRA